MSISQYTLALIAMCLNQAAVTPNSWDVSVTSPVQALQGMSVIFNCSFQHPYENISPSHIRALWLEDPCDEKSQILYSSEKDSKEGVSFIGDLGKKNCSLRMHDVKITNSKKYCFRFEIQEKDRWTGKPGVTLTVYAYPTKPTLSFSPELVEGVRTTLTCSSSNIAEHFKFRLKWYGLGEKTEEEESLFIHENRMLKSTVTVTLSYKDHNKVIKCSVISSEYSFMAETQETLKVNYAPKNITIQVEDRSQLEIKEGDKVSLTCASNSNPEATYGWYKRDKGHVKDFDSKYGTLLFQNISPSDSGFYSCTATNYLGNLTSEVVEIPVQYAPKNVTIQVEDRSQLEIKEGDKVTLTCASNSHPEATYSWYKRDKGQFKDFDSKYGTLLFQGISQSDSGFYSCTATNYLGNQSSEAMEIPVQYAPRNTTIYVENRSQMEIKEDDNISLLCTSHSYPEATYTWYRRKEDNGQTMALNSTRGALLFHSISRRDSGMYTCTASNYLGNQTSEDWEISVYYKPTQVNLTRDGMSFHCTAEANPPARISWNHTDTAIEVRNGTWTISTLTLQTMTSGCVSCQAQNKLGFMLSEEQCFKSTMGAILPQVIAGSIVVILLLLASLLWTQRKRLIRGKKLECDSQPVTHTEMENLPEIEQTNNSVVGDVYDNLCTSRSGEGKHKLSGRYSGDALHYASLRFFVKHKGPKAARPNSEQAKPSDAQVTASADGAVYENMAMFKTTREEPGAANNDPGETTLYACVKADNLQDNSK